MSIYKLSPYVTEAFNTYKVPDYVRQTLEEKLFPNSPMARMTNNTFGHFFRPLYLAGNNLAARLYSSLTEGAIKQLDMTNPEDRRIVEWAFKNVSHDYRLSQLEDELPKIQQMHVERFRVQTPETRNLPLYGFKYQYRTPEQDVRVTLTSMDENLVDINGLKIQNRGLDPNNGQVRSLRNSQVKLHRVELRPGHHTKEPSSYVDISEYGRGSGRFMTYDSSSDRQGARIVRLEDGVTDYSGRFYTAKQQQEGPNQAAKETFTIGEYRDAETDQSGAKVPPSGIDNPFASSPERLANKSRHTPLFKWERHSGPGDQGRVLHPRST